MNDEAQDRAVAEEAIRLGVFEDWITTQPSCRGYEYIIPNLSVEADLCIGFEIKRVVEHDYQSAPFPSHEFRANLYRFATGIWCLEIVRSTNFDYYENRILFRISSELEAAWIVRRSETSRRPADIAWAKALPVKRVAFGKYELAEKAAEADANGEVAVIKPEETKAQAASLANDSFLVTRELPKAWDASKVSVLRSIALASRDNPETVAAWDLRNAEPVLGQEVIEPWESFDNCFTTKRIAIYRLGAGKYLRIFQSLDSERGYISTREKESASLVDAKQVLADFHACGLSDIVPDLISNEAFGTPSSERPELGSHSSDADRSLSSEYDEQAAISSGVTDAAIPEGKSEPLEVPRGVSLRDVVLLVNEKDQDGLSRAVRRWSDSKTIKARTLGRCPNDGRALLYELSEILSDARKYFTLSQQKFVAIEKALRFAIRPIKQEESD